MVWRVRGENMTAEELNNLDDLISHLWTRTVLIRDAISKTPRREELEAGERIPYANDCMRQIMINVDLLNLAVKKYKGVSKND